MLNLLRLDRFQDFFVEELEVEIANIRHVLIGLDEVVNCLQIELMASQAVRLLQALCNSNGVLPRFHWTMCTWLYSHTPQKR